MNVRTVTLSLLLLLAVGPVVASEPAGQVEDPGSAVTAGAWEGSPGTELSAASDAAPWEPALRLTKPLVSAESCLNDEGVGSTVVMLRERFQAEARVESEGEKPSYWRVLGPVLITVGVGSATWLLFTLRSS